MIPTGWQVLTSAIMRASVTMNAIHLAILLAKSGSIFLPKVIA